MIKLMDILKYDNKIVELFLESPLRYKRWDLNILDTPSKNYLFTISVKEKGKFIENFDGYKIWMKSFSNIWVKDVTRTLIIEKARPSFTGIIL